MGPIVLKNTQKCMQKMTEYVPKKKNNNTYQINDKKRLLNH